MIVGLALVPALAFGPRQAWNYTVEWSDVFLQPVLNRGGDHARDKELVEATATDSQSPLRLIHFAMYPHLATRPADAAPWVRYAHWLIGGLLAVATLWSMGRRPLEGSELAVGLGALTIVMLMLSPVCHQHYLCLMLPAAAGLIAFCWEKRAPAWLPRVLVVLLPFVSVAMGLPFIPGLGVLRDHGLPGFTALVLLAVSCVVLYKARQRADTTALLARPARIAA
jgi:hypothetical protein